MSKTNLDLIAVCKMVLASKARGEKSVLINGIRFDDNFYNPAEGGRCQENARKAYGATTGVQMPGRDCCAGKTYRNLRSRHTKLQVVGPQWDERSLYPGDYLFFGGGPACRTCKGPVGHVGIYMENNKMFQQTSRDKLGITDQGPTTNQLARFLGAFRLLPLAEGEMEAAVAIPVWAQEGVDWCRTHGFMTNDNTDNFHPHRSVTRAELATILLRIVGKGGLR